MTKLYNITTQIKCTYSGVVRKQLLELFYLFKLGSVFLFSRFTFYVKAEKQKKQRNRRNQKQKQPEGGRGGRA
jgi:hypothetical protein